MGIIVERHGAAAVVILDWPEQRNALGPDRVRELIDTVKSAVDDESVAGLVLTGNGAFSAGGDVKGMATRVDMPAEERRKTVYSAYQGIITTLLDLPVPTVAAIDGAAVGFGLDIALACDSRFVGPNGFCMQGWARVGLVAGSGGILLMRMRAPGVLWRMLENQPRIDGPTAEQFGIAEAVLEGTARQRAIARVNNYASVSRSALTAYCELDRALLKSLLPEHHAAVLDRQMPLLKSREHRDAVQQPGQ